MVTDPVTSIQEHDLATPFPLDLSSLLRRLAALPPSTDAPYLTLSLDWRPDGGHPDIRPARLFFDQAGSELLSEFRPHTPAGESVSGDLERIAEILDGGIDPATKGVIFFACGASDLFVTAPLGEPVPNRLVTGPTPALRLLAGHLEDRPPFAILVADQTDAHLLLIDQTRPVHSLEVEATGYPRKQAQGGLSQHRYQARADERVEAFAATVAEETRRVLDDTRTTIFVLGGEQRITTALRDAFHPTVRSRLVGTFRPDLDRLGWDKAINVREAVAAALPIVDSAERQRELATVREIREGAGPGGRSVTGPAETLTALQSGQVLTLVMNDDFAASGWADYELPLFGVGPLPTAHPAGGHREAIVPVAIEEEMIRLASQTDAAIEVVRSSPPIGPDKPPTLTRADQSIPRTDAARELDELGGVGATLRFTLTPDTSTPML